MKKNIKILVLVLLIAISANLLVAHSSLGKTLEEIIEINGTPLEVEPLYPDKPNSPIMLTYDFLDIGLSFYTFSDISGVKICSIVTYAIPEDVLSVKEIETSVMKKLGLRKIKESHGDNMWANDKCQGWIEVRKNSVFVTFFVKKNKI